MANKILLKPDSTLYFRSGRSFDMGSDNFSQVTFPPNPDTFFGALVTSFISGMGTLQEFRDGKFEKYIGTPETNNFTEDMINLKKYYYRFDKKEYFPLPKDIVATENQDLIIMYCIKNDLISSIKSEYRLKSNKRVKGLKNCYINKKGLIAYLTNDFSKITKKDVIEEDKFYSLETKTGISINKDRKVVEESMLYSVNSLRFNDQFGFIIEGNIDFNRKEVKNIPKYIKLGSDGKVCRLNIDYENDIQIEKQVDIINNQLEKEEFLKMYVLTPMICKTKEKMKKGIYPSILEKYFDILAVANSRFKKIGGFDMHRRVPKPMYPVVPEGSVYYMKFKDGINKREALNLINNKNISDTKSSKGYGNVLLGLLNIK